MGDWYSIKYSDIFKYGGKKLIQLLGNLYNALVESFPEVMANNGDSDKKNKNNYNYIFSDIHIY